MNIRDTEKRWLCLIGCSFMIGIVIHAKLLLRNIEEERLFQLSPDRVWTPGPCIDFDLPFSRHFPYSDSYFVQWSLVAIIFTTGLMLFIFGIVRKMKANPIRASIKE